MARALRRIFVGRTDELNKVKSLIQAKVKDADNRPIIVTGEDGIGKSALLSQLCADLAAVKETEIARHFVGANPESFSPINLLKRFCTRLAKVCVCVCVFVCVCVCV